MKSGAVRVGATAWDIPRASAGHGLGRRPTGAPVMRECWGCAEIDASSGCRASGAPSIGCIADESLAARPPPPYRMAIAAAPVHLKRQGRPQEPGRNAGTAPAPL